MRPVLKSNAEARALEVISQGNVVSQHRALSAAARAEDCYQFAISAHIIIVQIADTVRQIVSSPQPTTPDNWNTFFDKAGQKPDGLNFKDALKYLCVDIAGSEELHGFFKDLQINNKANQQKHTNKNMDYYNIGECVKKYNKLIEQISNVLGVHCFSRLKIEAQVDYGYGMYGVPTNGDILNVFEMDESSRCLSVDWVDGDGEIISGTFKKERIYDFHLSVDAPDAKKLTYSIDFKNGESQQGNLNSGDNRLRVKLDNAPNPLVVKVHARFSLSLSDKKLLTVTLKKTI